MNYSKKANMKSTNYKDDYLQRLKDSKYTKGLLIVAFQESLKDGNWQAFGLLLNDIIDARGKKNEFAKKTKISRQHLYRLFAKNANPTLKTIVPILQELGLKLTVK